MELIETSDEKERGCGTKQTGGLYMCVGLVEQGLPLEEFVIDPARVWNGGPFRAPILVPRKDSGVNDVLMWVGAENYPTVPDYVEEVRWMGVSKRIPNNFDPSQLTPNDSRLILVHPKAIPLFDYQCLPSRLCRKPQVEHAPCTFHLWDLSGLEGDRDTPRHQLSSRGKDRNYIHIPCGRIYEAPDVIKVPEERPYQAGAFMTFKVSHFEFCKGKDKPVRMKKTIQDRFNATDWEIRTVTE